MVKNILINIELADIWKRFLRAKRRRASDVLSDMAQEVRTYEYYNTYHPKESHEKKSVCLTMSEETYTTLVEGIGDSAKSPVIADYMYTYILRHKDDEPAADKADKMRYVTARIKPETYEKLLSKGCISRYVGKLIEEAVE